MATDTPMSDEVAHRKGEAFAMVVAPRSAAKRLQVLASDLGRERCMQLGLAGLGT